MGVFERPLATKERTMSNRKYRTTIVVDTDHYPKEWSLENFYWAVENAEADCYQQVVELNPDYTEKKDEVNNPKSSC
jgi:hypothetical protein